MRLKRQELDCEKLLLPGKEVEALCGCKGMTMKASKAGELT
jgi:hypothetical protein